MKLPERYLEVTVASFLYPISNGGVGSGILDKMGESHCLILFTDAGTSRYSRGEVKELYTLYNPEDGLQYDLDKILE